MKKLLLCLGMLWASPLTIVSLLFYVLPFWALRWYQYCGWYDDAFVWKVNDKAPNFLLSLWAGWGGHCCGNAIVLVKDPESLPVILRHEREHVFQCMTLGIFQPVLYALNMLTCVLTRGMSAYLDCTFERAARRAAGQEK